MHVEERQQSEGHVTARTTKGSSDSEKKFRGGGYDQEVYNTPVLENGLIRSFYLFTWCTFLFFVVNTGGNTHPRECEA